MKKIRSFLAVIALIATLPISIFASLITILVFLVIGLAVTLGLRTQNSSITSLIVFGIGLAIVSIIGGILVIFQTAREKRANEPDVNQSEVSTKSVLIRVAVSLGDKPIMIEAPDAKSAAEVVEALQAYGITSTTTKGREQEKQESNEPEREA